MLLTWKYHAATVPPCWLVPFPRILCHCRLFCTQRPSLPRVQSIAPLQWTTAARPVSCCTFRNSASQTMRGRCRALFKYASSPICHSFYPISVVYDSIYLAILVARLRPIAVVTTQVVLHEQRTQTSPSGRNADILIKGTRDQKNKVTMTAMLKVTLLAMSPASNWPV